MSTCQLPRPVPAVWDAALSNGGGGGVVPALWAWTMGGQILKNHAGKSTMAQSEPTGREVGPCRSQGGLSGGGDAGAGFQRMRRSLVAKKGGKGIAGRG